MYRCLNVYALIMFMHRCLNVYAPNLFNRRIFVVHELTYMDCATLNRCASRQNIKRFPQGIVYQQLLTIIAGVSSSEMVVRPSSPATLSYNGSCDCRIVNTTASLTVVLSTQRLL